MNFDNSIRSSNETITAKIYLANAVSQALLMTIERQFLNVPLDKAPHIRHRVSRMVTSGEPVFLKLEQVGHLPLNDRLQSFRSIQLALAACHNPGKFRLVFLVSSDGLRDNIYLGLVPIPNISAPDEPADEYLNNIGQLIEANHPGTKFRLCEKDSQEYQNYISKPLGLSAEYRKCFRKVHALTGIPSIMKSDGLWQPPGLDKLLSGLRGTPFVYMVIADPLSEYDVNEIISRSRDLTGALHSLAKISLSESFSLGKSFSLSQTETHSTSYSQGTSESESMSYMSTADYLGLASFGCIALGGLIPPLMPLGFLAGLMSMTAAQSNQKSTGKTSQQTQSTSTGHTSSNSNSINLGQAFGTEYVNAHVESVLKELRTYVERFESYRSLGCWNTGVYLLTQNDIEGKNATTQLSAILNGRQSSLEPIRVHDLSKLKSDDETQSNNDPFPPAALALREFTLPRIEIINPNLNSKIVEQPLGVNFGSLTTPLNGEELAMLINLPQKEVPGVRSVPSATFGLNPNKVSDNVINLGKLIEGGEPTPIDYCINTDSLTKHILLSGINGSGKSTTCRRFLQDLGNKKIPFLIIEPAKTEYVEWAEEYNSQLSSDDPNRINIYVPGSPEAQANPNFKELNLNPLDIVWLKPEVKPAITSHIDRVKSIFMSAFPLQEVLPLVLEDLIYAGYMNKGWLEESLPEFNSERTSIIHLIDILKNSGFVKNKKYDERTTMQITAALNTRLQNFGLGWKRTLFNPKSTKSTPWDQLFDQPTIINLSYLADSSDKALMMAVIVQFLYEYREAQIQIEKLVGPRDKITKLRHLTVIEEAHRILLRPETVASGFANPQGKIAEMFSDLLSEMRAWGEGFMIVDQVPSRLIPDAIKNTNLKIAHRLVSADDREIIGSGMGLTPEQQAVLNRLRPGQALAFGDLDDQAYWVQISE